MAGVPSGTEAERWQRGASRPERPVDAGAGRSGSLPGRNLAGWGPRASRRSGECFQARDSGRQLRSAGNKTRTDTLVSSRSSGGDNNTKSRPPPAVPRWVDRHGHRSIARGRSKEQRMLGAFWWPGLGAELTHSPLLTTLTRSYTSIASELLAAHPENGHAKSRDGPRAHLFV